VAALTSDELALLIQWFETVELSASPLRAAQGAEIRKPEAWRQQVLWDIRFGPGGLYWETAVGEVRWLAKRIGPPDVQAVAHTDELAEQQGRPL